MDQLSLSIDAYTKQGLRRSINQDCIGIGSWRGGAGGGTELSLNYLCEQKSELFLLSDGIGGHDDGEIASRFAVDSIFELFQSQDNFDILSAISETHSKLAKIGFGSLRPLGATLVGLILTKNLVTIFSLGDSGCFHFNDNKLINVTEGKKSPKIRSNIIENCNAKWITYLSATSVYGDHKGEWVNEESKTKPITSNGIDRLSAEKLWLSLNLNKKIKNE